MNDLREFSGPVTGPCPDCSENGPQDECDTCGGPYCYACGGSGEADPEAKDRVGRIYGRLVNRRLLARLLEHAPDDPVRVSTGEEESSPVYIAGDDWTAIIMPMREPSHESQWHYSLPQPEFDPERAPTP